MGYRIQVSFHATSSTEAPTALIHANSHHPDYDLDGIVKWAVRTFKYPSAILAGLLQQKYVNASGGHYEGQPIFTLCHEPGDAEKQYAIVTDPNRGAKWFTVPVLGQAGVAEKAGIVAESILLTAIAQARDEGEEIPSWLDTAEDAALGAVTNLNSVETALQVIATQSWSNEKEQLDAAVFMRKTALDLRKAIRKELGHCAKR